MEDLLASFGNLNTENYSSKLFNEILSNSDKLVPPDLKNYKHLLC
jgi:hypothetical protein